MPQIIPPPSTVNGQPLGLTLPFTGGLDPVFALNFTTLKQLQANLAYFFNTQIGELPLNPQFGSNIRTRVFDMVNDYIKQQKIDRKDNSYSNKIPTEKSVD
jgi:phage baseplate assembly protein W